MAFYRIKYAKSALLPVIFMYWFLGMGVIEYPFGRPRRIFGFLYSVTVFAGYAIYPFVPILIGIESNRFLNSGIDRVFYIVTYGMIFLIGFFIFGSIICNKERDHCITELEDINRTMKEMGAIRSYERFLLSQIWKFGILLLLIILLNTCLYFDVWQALGKLHLSGELLFYDYPLFVTTTNGIMFSSVNEMIAGSFKDLNSLLESMTVKHPHDLHAKEDNNLVQVNVVPRDEQKIEILHCIRKIYARLACVAEHWNKLNAVFLLPVVVSSTGILTIRIYTVYNLILIHGINSILEITFIQTVLVSIFSAGKLSIILHSAVCLTSEAHRTCDIVLNLNHIASLRSEVHIFSMQLIQNPLHLSFLGIHSMDYALFQQILASVTTYSIMFIQTMDSPTDNLEDH